MTDSFRLAMILGMLAAAASAAETAQQRGKRVVDEAVKALGGNAFLNMSDRVESGRAYSFYNRQVSGLSVAKIYTRYLAPTPGKLSIRERDAFGIKEYAYQLFTAEGAWDISFHGVRPLPDERYDTYKDSTLRDIFYIVRQRLNEPGMDFYSRGADIFQNTPVEIVDITDADNRTTTVYFSQITKLPIRQSFRRRNPEFKDFDEEVTIYTNYHDVGGGVQWPFVVHRERNGDKIYEMYAESVQVNQDLKDNLFALPSNLKMLPKEK
jgi:hypothetical protein